MSLPTGQEKMDLDVVSGEKPRARWATAEKIKERREKQQCLRCGALGHRVRFCRYAPAVRPKEVPVAQHFDSLENDHLK